MLLRTLIIFLFFIPHAYAGQAEDKAEFKRLYAEFNELYANADDLETVINVAVKVYDLAPKVYGKKHANTAVVTYNLAKLYDEIGNLSIEYTTRKKFYKLKASYHYKEYFAILKSLKRSKDAQYVSQYFRFVIAEIHGNNFRSEKKYASRLIKFAKDIDIPQNEIADLEFNIAIAIIGVADPRDAQKYLRSSFERNSHIYPDNHFKLGENLFWRAKLDLIKRRYKSAEERYLKALAIFEDNKDLAAHLIDPTRASLIALYEETNRPELTLKHSRALAVEREGDFDRNIEPIYKIMPDFPTRPGHTIPNGNISLEFNVDEDGKTKDIKVVETEHNEFIKPVIEAIEKWRYAPTIKNGVFVETLGLTYTIKFNRLSY